jgi:hypothetical protein
MRRENLIARALRGWLNWREARQRQQRFARMLKVNPDLRRAQQQLERDRQAHRPTRSDAAQMRAATHQMLRSSIHG